VESVLGCKGRAETDIKDKRKTRASLTRGTWRLYFLLRGGKKTGSQPKVLLARTDDSRKRQTSILGGGKVQRE